MVSPSKIELGKALEEWLHEELLGEMTRHLDLEEKSEQAAKSWRKF